MYAGLQQCVRCSESGCNVLVVCSLEVVHVMLEDWLLLLLCIRRHGVARVTF